MQEAKPAEAIYTNEETGEAIRCEVINSNILISGRRFMSIRIDGETKTVPAKDVEITEEAG